MPAKKVNRSTRTGLNLFYKSVLIANAFAVLFILLAYLAPVTDPQKNWPVAFFGLAYPLLLLINLVFILFWLIFKWRFAFISIIAILIGWRSLTGSIGFRSSMAISVPKSSKDFIRLMTYNVHFFKKFDYVKDVSTKDDILDIVRKEQPDILCFQEFLTRTKGIYNFKKAVNDVLGSKNMYFYPTVGNDFESTGLAIFSKYPIVNSGHIKFPDTGAGNEAVFADLQINQKIIRIYNLHLQSINLGPEDYQYLDEVKKDIKTDVQSSRRIGSRLKLAFKKRSEQVRILKEHAAKWNQPYIFCGDFNDTPSSYAVNYLSSGLKNAFREKGSGFAITYNGDFPNFQIDHILTSPQFTIKNYQIIDKKISDHYALRSDLELK